MFYLLENDSKKYGNIRIARKYAVDSFAYYNDIGVRDPHIAVYEANYVGKWKIGEVCKGPGYPIYKTKDGTVYRISKSGDVRRIEKIPAPFGL